MTLVRRLLEDLEVLVGRAVRCLRLEVSRATSRPTAMDRVGLSFRFGFDRLDQSRAGVLVLSWPDAAVLAAAFDGAPDERLRGERTSPAPGERAKAILLELGPYLAAVLEAALAEVGCGDVLARFDSVQGLRPGARPALDDLEAEAEWVTMRMEIEISGFEPGPLLLLLPAELLD